MDDGLIGDELETVVGGLFVAGGSDLGASAGR